MKRRLLAVFAHPDDEAFGPGGTIAKYAAEGVEIHILSVTRGEEGDWDEKHKRSVQLSASSGQLVGRKRIQHVREEELRRSAKILGVKRVEFLDFIDGQLCNAVYHQLAEKIIKKINTFEPHVVLTIDRLGVSGHLDHIAVSMITTYSFLKTKFPRKLYYHCLPREWYTRRMRNYFIYFPEGYPHDAITTRVDYARFWSTRKQAMQQHESQAKDVRDVTKMYQMRPKRDHYILQYFRGGKIQSGETDLFAGIDGW